MSENLPAIVDFSPLYPVPEGAPPMPFDVTNSYLSADLIPSLNANFMSATRLREWLNERDADSRTVTVTGVSVELVYNPLEGETPDKGEWKPCLSFAETPEMLVVNIPRRKQLERLTQSSLLARWAEVGQTMLMVTGEPPTHQITIMAVPGSTRPNRRNGNGRSRQTVSQINDELFG